MTTQKTERASVDIQNENLEKLRTVFPQFVKDGQIDFDALTTFFGKEGIIAGPEKYGLSWAGKSDAFKAIRVPATGTLVPQEKESKDWDATQNLFIEGDNLEVLKLLQKHYANPGKIKMIYIDPPYNTGKDFIYKDNFTENRNDYYERTGQSEGGVKLTSNMESNGRYHSDWLTMMYPRLFLAKNLLKDDGVIFVSIDDNEVANLRLIMDELFGEENFVADIIWNSTKSVTNTALISVAHTHNLVYARNANYWIENREEFRLPENGEGFENPDNDSRGPWKADPFQVGGWRPNQQYEITNPKTGDVYHPNAGSSWKNDFEKFQELVVDNRIVFGVSGEAGPQRKRFLSEATERGRVSTTLWSDIQTTANGTQTLKELFGEAGMFTNPKPVELIARMFKLSTMKDEGHIVLDFFAGSGTTAHAVMAQNAEDGGNRKWICVQIPEETAEESEAHKAGFKTIADISRERIRRAGEKVHEEFLQEKLPERRGLQEVYGYKDREIAELEGEATADLDIGFKSFALAPSNYRQWSVLTEKDDEEKLKAQMKLFADKPLVDGASEESVAYEVLLKEGFDLNAEVRQEERGGIALWLATSSERIAVITLAPKLSREQVDALGLAKDALFICLDSALDDSLKVNLSKNFNLKVI